MGRTQELIERVEKLEAEVAELRKQLAPKPPAKGRSAGSKADVTMTFAGDE